MTAWTEDVIAGLVKAAVQKLDGFQPAQLLEWLRAELSQRPLAAQSGSAIYISPRAKQALANASGNVFSRTCAKSASVSSRDRSR